MKLTDAKKHMAENSVLHLTLLLQAVTQIYGGITHLLNQSRKTGRHNRVTSLQKMLEKSTAQVENLTTETNFLKQKVFEHESRLKELETSHASSNDTGAWGGASDVTELMETTRRVNDLDAKTADIEKLMTESNRTLKELKSRVAFLTRHLKTSQDTVLRLERRVESQVLRVLFLNHNYLKLINELLVRI